MEEQLALFKYRPSDLERPQRLMIGGIYRDDNDEPDYDGCYALCMGSDQFYFIFDEIQHIEEIVEVACQHEMKLMEGYTLAIITEKDSLKWQIRDSGRKQQEDYILASGSCTESFRRSLDPYLKVFHK